MKFKRRWGTTGKIPESSLPDIAFLLIIFFLVSTTMYLEKGIGYILLEPGKSKKVPSENVCEVWVKEKW